MKILMAYDGSEHGLTGLLALPELTWIPHHHVDLLAILPMPSGLFLGEGYVPGEVLEEDRVRAQALLDSGVARLCEQGFETEGVLAAGEPIEEICRMAGRLSSNLIVVRHPQRQSFAARWWKGWVGSSLLEHAPCAILIAVDRHA